MRKIFGVITAGVMAIGMLALTACGVDKDKLKGDWQIDTIAGKSAAEYAQEHNTVELSLAQNYKIEDDKITVETINANFETNSKDYKTEWKGDGVEAKDGDTIVQSFKLDGDKVLTYYNASAMGGGDKEEVVLKKGSFDFNAGIADYQGQIADAMSGAEGAAAAEGDAAPEDDAAAESEEAAE